MSLTLDRLSGTEEAPLAVEVVEVDTFTPASSLLLHISDLKGVRVLAKKGWPLADHFEAYFQYKDCRYRMSIPKIKIRIEALAPLVSAEEFAQVEDHVRRYSPPLVSLSMAAVFWTFCLPANVR